MEKFKLIVLFFSLVSVSFLYGLPVRMAYGPYSFYNYMPNFSDRAVGSTGVYQLSTEIPSTSKSAIAFSFIYDDISESWTETFYQAEDDYSTPQYKYFKKHHPGIGLMTGPKLYYIKSKHIRLYGDLQAGLVYNNLSGKKRIGICFQLNPLGIELGDKMALSTEAGLGIKGFINCGFIYKF